MSSTGANGLSNRGMRAIKPALAYWERQIEGSKHEYHRETNPEGYVLMAVAENKLTFKLLQEKLGRARCIDPSTTQYANMRGREGFRSAIAQFLTSCFVPADSPIRINPEFLTVSSGCGAIFMQLGFLLCNPGDAVLLPTPTYAALYNDLQTLPDTVIVDMPTESTGYRITQELLDDTKRRSEANGHPVRMLLLLHPHNPLGTMYSREEITMAITWCRANKIHCIIDEIYANSTYGTPTVDTERVGSAKDIATEVASDDEEAADADLDAVVPNQFTSSLEIAYEMACEAATTTMGAVSTVPATAGGSSSSSSSSSSSCSPGCGFAASSSSAHSPSSQSGDVERSCACDRTTVTASCDPTVTATSDGFLGDYVHLLWGFSKDWCLGGFRVGLLYSHNATLRRAFDNVNYFTTVSNDTQDALAHLLEDPAWCHRFLNANRRVLRRQAARCMRACTALGLPYIPPVGGMYLWFDCRPLIRQLRRTSLWTATSPQHAGALKGDTSSTFTFTSSNTTAPAMDEPITFEDEEHFLSILFNTCHVLFTPGHSCHSREAGWFRCCFASLEDGSALNVAFDRIRSRLMAPSMDAVIAATASMTLVPSITPPASEPSSPPLSSACSESAAGCGSCCCSSGAAGIREGFAMTEVPKQCL